MEYGKCGFCGGKVIDAAPCYIPLGADTVLEIIDQTCDKCGATIIGPHQKTKTIKSKEAHDKLCQFLKKYLHE